MPRYHLTRVPDGTRPDGRSRWIHVLVDPRGFQVATTTDENHLTGRRYTRAELQHAARTYNQNPATAPDNARSQTRSSPTHKQIMVALAVHDSAEDGPDLAIVTLTTRTVLRYLAEIQQARSLIRVDADGDGPADSGPEGRVYQTVRWDNSPTWLDGGELADELGHVVDTGFQVLTLEQAAKVGHASREHGAHADIPRRFVTTGDVQWRAAPKYGPGEWETTKLSEADLERILGEYLLPTQARFYYPVMLVVQVEDGKVTYAEFGSALDGLPAEWIDDTQASAGDPVACPDALGRVIGDLIDRELPGAEGRALQDGVTVYAVDRHPLALPFTAYAG